MQQEQSLNLNLSQHLVMSMKLQQAIQILQLSAQDLKAEIEKEYMENPALEMEYSDGVTASQGEVLRAENVAALGDTTLTGHLLASAERMQDGRTMLSPLQDAMSKNARETWLLECVPAVADGSMSAEECWRTVMDMNPFGE